MEPLQASRACLGITRRAILLVFFNPDCAGWRRKIDSGMHRYLENLPASPADPPWGLTSTGSIRRLSKMRGKCAINQLVASPRSMAHRDDGRSMVKGSGIAWSRSRVFGFYRRVTRPIARLLPEPGRGSLRSSSSWYRREAVQLCPTASVIWRATRLRFPLPRLAPPHRFQSRTERFPWNPFIERRPAGASSPPHRVPTSTNRSCPIADIATSAVASTQSQGLRGMWEFFEALFSLQVPNRFRT